MSLNFVAFFRLKQRLLFYVKCSKILSLKGVIIMGKKLDLEKNKQILGLSFKVQLPFLSKFANENWAITDILQTN